MIERICGNMLILQSGAATMTANTALAGAISESLNHECIEEIYASMGGLSGLVSRRLIDLAEESQQTIRNLRFMPGCILGVCTNPLQPQELEYALETIINYNIRFVVAICGTELLATLEQLQALAISKAYRLHITATPNSANNDIPVTDHSPGYGSTIKALATAVRSLGIAYERTHNNGFVSIIELSGQSNGWVAAGASLAKRCDNNNDAPQILLLPERAFSTTKFIRDVQTVLKSSRYCIVVACDNLVDENGNYILGGHEMPSENNTSSIGTYLSALVSRQLNVTAEILKPGSLFQVAATCVSQVDSNEAFLAGQAAVSAAIAGQSNKMITLLRGETEQYNCETSLVPISEVSNGTKKFPDNWIHDDGISVSFQYSKYAFPLIQGEIPITYENGSPAFVHLKKNYVQPQEITEVGR